MRGIFIKLGARRRRRRQQRILDLTTKIHDLEKINKQISTPATSKHISQLRYELCLLFLENFEKSARRSNMNYYVNGNRAGKLLAQRIKGCRYKSKIPYITHSLTKEKHYHPQDIADTFSH